MQDDLLIAAKNMYSNLMHGFQHKANMHVCEGMAHEGQQCTNHIITTTSWQK
jgi:hypothetical protein